MRTLEWNEPVLLSSGGELRAFGPRDAGDVVLLVGGGTGQSAPGRWSASMSWLAPRIARAVGPGVRIAQVRYLDTSWDRIDRGIADVRAALAHVTRGDGAWAPDRIVIVALSMGGATSLANADADHVVGLVAMAPWFPMRIPVDTLVGRRLFVVHGSLDNALPFVPGTSLQASRAAVERARGLGIDACWRGMPFGLHGLAVRVRGRLVRLPRARAYARVIAREVVGMLPPVEVSRTDAAQ